MSGPRCAPALSSAWLVADERGPHRSEAQFAALVEALAGRDDVTFGGGRGFGSGTLQVRGRIFAVVSGRAPGHEAPAVARRRPRPARRRLPFDAGKGKPMREWVALIGGSADACLALAREAMRFVAGP